MMQTKNLMPSLPETFDPAAVATYFALADHFNPNMDEKDFTAFRRAVRAATLPDDYWLLLVWRMGYPKPVLAILEHTQLHTRCVLNWSKILTSAAIYPLLPRLLGILAQANTKRPEVVMSEREWLNILYNTLDKYPKNWKTVLKRAPISFTLWNDLAGRMIYKPQHFKTLLAAASKETAWDWHRFIDNAGWGPEALEAVMNAAPEDIPWDWQAMAERAALNNEALKMVARWAAMRGAALDYKRIMGSALKFNARESFAWAQALDQAETQPAA